MNRWLERDTVKTAATIVVTNVTLLTSVQWWMEVVSVQSGKLLLLNLALKKKQVLSNFPLKQLAQPAPGFTVGS